MRLEDGSYFADSTDGSLRAEGEAAYYFATPYFREMIESLDLIAVVLDRTGRLVYCNGVLLARSEHTESEAIGRDWFQTFVPPEDRAEAQLYFKKIVRGEVPPRMHESRLVTRRGVVHTVAWATTPLRSDKGQCVGLASVGVDITEAERTRQALEESETRFGELARSIDDVFWMADWRARKLLFVNPAFERVFGRPLSTAQEDPLSWLETVHFDDRERAESLFRTAVPPKSVDTALRIITSSGETRWIHIRAHAVEEKGAGSVVVGIVQDITRQRRAEEKILRLNEELEHRVEARTQELAEALSQLREREAAVLLESAINQGVARVASAMISLERHLKDIGRIVLDEACRLTGCRSGFITEIDARRAKTEILALVPDNAVGMVMNSGELLFHGARARLREWAGTMGEYRAGFITNQPSCHPVFVGNSRPATLGISSFLYVPAIAGGELLGQIALANKTEGFSSRDLRVCEKLADLFALSIAGLRRAEELETARDAAEAANRAKSQFLSTMSHELRSPLNVIIGLSDVLCDTTLNGQQRYLLDTLRAASDVLLRLVNEVLDLSRIEAGKVEPEVLPVDLVHLVDSVCGVFRNAAAGKGIVFTSEIAPGTPLLLYGDVHRLRQILVNLVGNAIKFTRQGRVALCAEASTGWPHRGDTQHTEVVRLVFRVMDTGIGIPKDRLETIFEGFTQVDTSIARQFGGSGLGLTIARQLAQLLGGRLSVQSELGQGSCFELEVPLEVASGPCQPFLEASGSPAIFHDEAARDSIIASRVLLVEDSADNQLVVAAFLAGTPIELEVVNNGFDALGMFERKRYNLVLMDIQMPMLDGLATTRLLRQLENYRHWPRTPIVALSAHAINGASEDAESAGCDDYITKPIRKDAFLAVMARYLGRPITPVPQLAFEGDQPAPRDFDARPRPEAQAIEVQVDPALVPHLGSFLSSVSRSLDDIERHLERHDLEAIAAIGHRLKGDGGTYGLDRVTQLGLVCQSAANNDATAVIIDTVRELRDYLQRVCVAKSRSGPVSEGELEPGGPR